jgi:Ca-activated chloride channel family protein
VLSRLRLYHVLVLFGVTAIASAQSPSPANAPEDRFLAPVVTISREVNEVNLAFTVTDHKGHFISNLRPEDFELRDNRLLPHRLTFFQQRSDLPLHLAVLIDASASVKYCFKMEQNSALAFVKKMLRPDKDKAVVIAFNDRVTTIQDLTDRTSNVSKAIHKVNADGNTSLYEAVIYASDKLREIPEDGMTRRAIVLVTDGVDTVSRATLQQAEAEAARAEVMIFALSTNAPDLDLDDQGETVLKQLTFSTGGAVLPAYDAGRLTSSFHNVAKALHNQYVVAYRPPDFRADGTYHKVEIVPVKNGLRTNCRKGYFAKSKSTY